MPTLEEIVMSQESTNGNLSLALVLVLDILQKTSLPADTEESVRLLKETIQQTPGRRPPFCRVAANLALEAQGAVSDDLNNNLFEIFWRELHMTQS